MNGFCMQETSFPFICTILDDSSTDGAQDIIIRYLREFFYMQDTFDADNYETDDYTQLFAQHKTNHNCFFRVVLLKYNHYQVKKSKYPYFDEINDVKYIALCEGDDYWTCSSKLQKQVEMLESDSTYGMVYSKAKVFDSDKQTLTNYLTGEEYSGFDSLLYRNYIPTLTVCLESSLFFQYREEYKTWDTKDWKMGDYPMWLWFAQKTNILFINKPMAVYRKHYGSASYSKDMNKRIEFCKSSYAIRRFFLDYFNQSQLSLERLNNAERLSLANIYLDYNNINNALVAVRGSRIEIYLSVIFKTIVNSTKRFLKKIGVGCFV